MGTLIGKKFKSKINGKVFEVIELHTEANQQNYKIRELASGQLITANKRVFEEMCLTNLDEIQEKRK